jgi:hypothetical protein
MRCQKFSCDLLSLQPSASAPAFYDFLPNWATSRHTPVQYSETRLDRFRSFLITSVRRGISPILSITSPLRIPSAAHAGANMGWMSNRFCNSGPWVRFVFSSVRRVGQVPDLPSWVRFVISRPVLAFKDRSPKSRKLVAPYPTIGGIHQFGGPTISFFLITYAWCPACIIAPQGSDAKNSQDGKRGGCLHSKRPDT